ncbi:uncharacterized protein L969DRAFT_84076 [Mixia osmundae IAM 14324]|nr:uncharacterized protein L969DRAFT_84076 [Mixia osmundae IAM 14324]KEI42211.1 hypothetical protein L969DRAFT_84076 [Mixia osmundae IAM 14324]
MTTTELKKLLLTALSSRSAQTSSVKAPDMTDEDEVIALDEPEMDYARLKPDELGLFRLVVSSRDARRQEWDRLSDGSRLSDHGLEEGAILGIGFQHKGVMQEPSVVWPEDAEES